MIIGHDRSIHDLKTLASKKRLAHGYIFFGPAKVGKCLTAKSLANYLETGDFFYSEDENRRVLQDCLLITPGEHGTIGIDALRAVRYFLWQRPVKSSYRTVIIDDGHLLTPEAQNSILKITEEPPPSALLIIVVHDPGILGPTLASRFQKIYFSAVPESSIKAWLGKRGLPYPNAEAAAGRSFGKPGVALALLTDKKFQTLLKSAEDLLRVSPSLRRDSIKKLALQDSFRFEEFLESLTFCLSWHPPIGKRQIELWHALLELCDQAARFNLNPRLQLENLLVGVGLASNERR